VLRRRAGESILVGDIEIEVIEVSRSRVKLGVRAPVHVPVIRKETLGVARENRMASELLAAGGSEGVGAILQAIRRPESLNETGAPPI
jgi:carbon storage regulator CsrA